MEYLGFTKAMESFASQWAHLCLTWVSWKLEFAVSVATMILGFWIPCTIYHGIDVFFPSFAAKHKVQSDPKRHPTNGQVWMLIGHAVYVCLLDLAGQAILTIITNFQPLFALSPTLPTIRDVLIHWTFAMLAREIIAYYAHRAIHHPRFYASIHKKHHSFTAPVAFAALYTTVTEHIIADVIPIVGPLAWYSNTVEPVHILTFQFFLLTLYLVGTAEHSGLDFAQPTVSVFHDLHHEKFTVNYGTLHFMDWLHGTDQIGWDQKKKQKAAKTEKGHRQAESTIGLGPVTVPPSIIRALSSI